eukprot:gnl/Spiro4/24162_TR11987_c0_g1_i1.p1 gnl/Spiro4/24162_TR11987_c0_g1~~gnl/Spiro4/24162_TR11987_c0_g1_i1.p1  ORF type:complete len:371 (-),score=124.51 gnl/Spiro4/24162_TR11987_c0_g1_i1:33-1091(-)
MASLRALRARIRALETERQLIASERIATAEARLFSSYARLPPTLLPPIPPPLWTERDRFLNSVALARHEQALALDKQLRDGAAATAAAAAATAAAVAAATSPSRSHLSARALLALREQELATFRARYHALATANTTATSAALPLSPQRPYGSSTTACGHDSLILSLANRVAALEAQLSRLSQNQEGGHGTGAAAGTATAARSCADGLNAQSPIPAIVKRSVEFDRSFGNTFALTEAELADLWSYYDRNHDGDLALDEVEEMIADINSELQPQYVAKLEDDFRAKGLPEVLLRQTIAVSADASKCRELNSRQAERLRKLLDVNHDGRVTREEFMAKAREVLTFDVTAFHAQRV